MVIVFRKKMSEKVERKGRQTMHKAAAWPILAVSLCLCGCGAVAEIPADAATPESAAMGVLLPQTDTDKSALLAMLALQRTPESALLLPDAVQLDVENIAQNPELPNGCEITSAAIVLNYLGIAADKVTLAEEYLPLHIPYWEADPEVEFMGSPADELSFYCLPGAVTTAVNAYLDDQGSAYRALDVTGADESELRMYLAQGTPVLVWTTRAFTEPLYNYTFTLADGSWPYANAHCLVLTGYDADNYYFADPMLEVTAIDRETFALRYAQLGSRAVVITE